MSTKTLTIRNTSTTNMTVEAAMWGSIQCDPQVAVMAESATSVSSTQYISLNGAWEPPAFTAPVNSASDGFFRDLMLLDMKALRAVGTVNVNGDDGCVLRKRETKSDDFLGRRKRKRETSYFFFDVASSNQLLFWENKKHPSSEDAPRGQRFKKKGN